MKASQQLLAEISQITREIEDHYPELQKYLDETPMTLSDKDNQVGNPAEDKALRDYLESLKEIVRNYKDKH